MLRESHCWSGWFLSGTMHAQCPSQDEVLLICCIQWNTTRVWNDHDEPLPNYSPDVHPLFFYGAAFLILSFSISIQNMKGSNLRIADSLWLLAVFGFTHGVREWLEIYPLLEGSQLSPEQIFHVKLIAQVLKIISFLFLLQFGLALSHENKRKRTFWAIGSYSALCVGWAYSVVSELMRHNLETRMLFLRQVGIGVRNSFGFFGAMMAAYGLIRYSREIKNLSNPVSPQFIPGGDRLCLLWCFYQRLFL